MKKISSTVRRRTLDAGGTRRKARVANNNELQKHSVLSTIKQHPLLYLMVIPGITYFVMFRIVPTFVSVIAWQKYSIFKGVLGSPWVGWDNFYRLFAYPEFLRIFSNTIIIGLLIIAVGFPIPIALALLLNEVRLRGFRRYVQTVIYLPHFLSWVIVGQLVYSVLSPTSGFVNKTIVALGGESIFFMAQSTLFKPIAILAFIWKESGFTSIIYLAAISGIDPNLYEASDIDGASHWQKIWNITLPSISPTIVVMLLIGLGRFLETGFDHIWNLLNPVVWSAGDILNTYIFRVGLQDGRYSLTAAMGIFKAVIGFVLLIIGNKVAERLTGKGFLRS
jgi:putative aldouronate transport system permease protein